MSSSDPNLQNIPSHNKDIRKMFVASPGYVLMSSDYSQQEPSCMASFCKEMGYNKLYDVRLNGGDLYSAVASACFNLPYEQCLEHNPDGTTNKEGKAIRNKAKPVLLGILYGRGDKSVAEGMGITLEEAKQLKANLFKKYPEIMIFERKSLEMGEDLGYVTTICGRKRRLPDLQLDEFEFKWVDAPKSDDVLDFDGEVNTEVPDEICNKYWRKLKQAKFGQKRKIFEEANKKDGVWIIDNGGKIADATRQCVNARIQGSAADLTKLAMVDLYHNEELKKLGFRMLIPVHDEIIAECPEENAKECSRLLAEVMSKAAEKILNMPFKCDVEITREWYGDSVELT
jgi:DNA polymerase I-like protein with 3'-5' exonuclease and polymerase domains